MPDHEAPEFSLQRPVTSALAVIRAVLFSPRGFYLSFSPEGPLREPAVFVLLSPLAVGVVAAVYLLSIRTFVGKVGTFREVYRLAAYAFGALLPAWIPIVGAFAVTYALMVVMGIAVRTIYRTSLLTAVVTALASFMPIGVALIWLRVMTAGLAS